MSKNLDVVCVGEALVDFLPDAPGKAVHEVERWVRCPGGSLANVATGLSRLGAHAGLIGVVGQDEFGTFLCERLAAERVDVSHLRRTPEGKTGLVFISLGPAGERRFAFYRTRSAEQFLCERDLEPAYVERARAIHFGTNSLLLKEAQEGVLKLAASAHQSRRIVTCDPNVRLHFWPEPRELLDLLPKLVPHVSVMKVSEEELEQVTGQRDGEAGLRWLAEHGVLLPILTLGEKGALFLFNDRLVRVAAPKVAEVVDTTGAGDGFMSGLLYGITRLYPDADAMKAAGVGEIRELVTFACAVGARVVTALGAVAGLPTRNDVASVLPRLLQRA